MTKPQPKIHCTLIDSDGQIREGQLLTETEAAVFDDPMFDALEFNVHVKGSYFTRASIQMTLAYILTRYTMSLRHEVASSRDDQSEQDEQENQAEPHETWIEDTK
jgi:hypothetical protein